MPDASGNAPVSRWLIPSSNRSSVFFFCIVNLFWWIGLYLYVPVLPVYIQESGAGLNMVGIVLSAYAIPQVLFRIPVGIWSDRLGKRKALVASGIIFTSLGALGLAMSSVPWLLFFSRMVTGIGAAMWVVFPVYFVAYYRPEDSDKAIGLINFVRSVALIAATAGSGFIAEEFGLRQPFFIAALLGIFAFIALLFTREAPFSRGRTASWRNLASVATGPVLLLVSAMAILLHYAVFTGVFGFIPVYAAEIGASKGELGLITMINLSFSALGALAAVWICERLGYRLTVVFSALLTGIGLLVVPFIGAVPVLMVVQSGFGLATGVLMTLMMTLSIRGVRPEFQATAMGVFQAVYAVGMMLGPLTSGFLGSALGLSSVFFLAASLVFVIVIMAFLPVFSRRLNA
jgi:MFS family permease